MIRAALPSQLREAAWVCTVVLLLAACATPVPEGPGRSRAPAYAFPVSPDTTFDMARGEPLTLQGLSGRLRRVRLLFLGEHHGSRRSHAFQAQVLARLLDQGRPLVVALEMLPPAADPALEAWRQGRLDEEAFLERSGWYRHWGYAWASYRELFALFRRHRIALRGVNTDAATRKAVRKGRLHALSAELRAEIGDLAAPLPPHREYVLDALREVGHGGNLSATSPAFQDYYRVQRMWDRLMGLRAARLAESLPPEGMVVLLVGSGHLTYGLGVNLQAARVSDVARLTVWDTVVERDALDARGRYPVPLGTADIVRVYVRSAEERAHPTLSGLKLARHDAGVRVEGVRVIGRAPLKALRAEDVILSLNGAPVRSPVALRLAYEAIRIGEPAELQVLRQGERLTIDIAPRG